MRSLISGRRWERLGTATAISLPILMTLSISVGLLDLLTAW